VDQPLLPTVPGDRALSFADYLSIPYIITVFSGEDDEGDWLRFAECPELPGCRVASSSVIQALDDLSRRRITLIADLLRSGSPPPVPRRPLPSVDVTEELRRLGVLDEFSSILELVVVHPPEWGRESPP
jgi:hypothetical protein